MTVHAVDDREMTFVNAVDGSKPAHAQRKAHAMDTARSTVASEVVYYEDENIHISNVKAEFGIKQHALRTYPTAEIKAARVRVQRAHVLPAYSVGAIGLVWGGLMLQASLTLGLVIAVVGLVIAFLFRVSVSNTYFLRLTTTSGEGDVLMSLHKRYIKTATEAVNKAIGSAGK